MKRLGYLFLSLFLLTISCTKTAQDVHFHGRVTLDCNSQMPINKCIVVITRVYDDGQSQSQSIGRAYTDNNGYYSFITDVKQKGSFMFYTYSIQTDYASYNQNSLWYGGGGQTKDNDNDIEVNWNITNSKAYKFHIKNVSPFNSGDVFNSLIVSHLDNLYHPTSELTNISSIVGMNVDTTFYKFYFNEPRIDYKYSYTKNGVLTSVPPDTLSIPNCLDTVTINIFY